MKKEESLLGIYAMILGIFALATVIHSVGLVAALLSLGLAIPAVLQKKTKRDFWKSLEYWNKICKCFLYILPKVNGHTIYPLTRWVNTAILPMDLVGNYS